jgi:hypothetical protein
MGGTAGRQGAPVAAAKAAEAVQLDQCCSILLLWYYILLACAVRDRVTALPARGLGLPPSSADR